ncbi:MAG TPA: RNB domain-containing ribonuclease [Acidimicrobiales bacterium]|nr:RNB domain-containing ribonuclease [Acidimicrobiales bacterium]
MPAVSLRLDPTVTAPGRRAGHLADEFDAIRSELGIEDGFPEDVLAETDAGIKAGPSIPATVDLREVPFLSIDPPGSMDLDQALALSRRSGPGGGFVVRYAIADVASFVRPGGAIDIEARRRVVTVYLPDRRAPLHPPALSEGAASLLPGQERQALVWTIELDAAGAPTSVRLERATVRSRARFTYEQVQRQLDAGSAEEPITLLQEIGLLREAAEVARGGVSLPLPDQQVVEIDGRYRLQFRAPLRTEGWNAQLSLLAGLAAARLMLDHGVGLLRTLPPPNDATVAALRHAARALGVPWPGDGAAPYPEFIRSLDPTVPAHAALVSRAARLFRGAGYLAFGDRAPVPDGDAAVHAAVAAPYAHVTAPLRRLVDRFGNEVVLAQCSGTAVPAWAMEALPELPALMDRGRHRENAANGMSLDLVEAAVLGGCVGAEVDGVVMSTGKGNASVQVREPAVVASIDGDDLTAGDEVRLRVAGADVAKRKVLFEVIAT